VSDSARQLSDPAGELAEVRASPREAGTVELIACRPQENERQVLGLAELDPAVGVRGDRWGAQQSPHGPDDQLTLVNSRAAALFAGPRSRWALAGDQLYVDLDLSGSNLPPGTRLSVGSAVIEVTAVPHTGCGKFSRRFGVEAQKLVNSAAGRELNLRGIHAKVITPGTVSSGDAIAKLG
jgi:MOSC domain-containing protein YiiM